MRNGHQLVRAVWSWFHPINVIRLKIHQLEMSLLSRSYREPVVGLRISIVFCLIVWFVCLGLFVHSDTTMQPTFVSVGDLIREEQSLCVYSIYYFWYQSQILYHIHPASVTLIEGWCMAFWSSELTGCQESLQMVRIMSSQSIEVFPIHCQSSLDIHGMHCLV